ncbi:MAG TPA: branched-chain amino acid ABC transporter permease [Thermohalobaculum sp.]|nr:branched-chain amino acid ABC transporter permease [Thermohalobaculum sp.]
MLQVITVLEIAGVYALLALGLVMIYRTSRILNLAQGEMAITCAYVAAVTTGAGLPWIVAIPATLATGAIIGGFVYFVIMRRILSESPVVGILTTVGIAILLRGLMVIIFGGETRMVDSPFKAVTTIAGARVTQEHLIVLVGSWTCVLFVIILNFFTKTGLLMRAVSDNVVLAAQRGINIDRIVGIAWVLALIIGAVAGFLHGQRALISIAAVFIGVNALIAALIGGMDSYPGAIIGALAVAVVEFVTTQLVESHWAEIALVALMLIVLTFRPWGLFGTVEELERV